MRLVSAEGIESITLPHSGRVVIGEDLPPGFDVDVLMSEVELFYGDRIQLQDEVTVEPQTVIPRKKRK